jgi:hypothetical protein
MMRLTKPTVTTLAATLLGGAFFLASTADARPEGPELFCATYPEAPGCEGQVVSCSQCHAGPPALNAYGVDVAINMAGYDGSVASYIAALPGALTSVEGNDADQDSISNLVEIELGTLPGDELSYWFEPAAPEGLPNDFYDVNGYDPVFAFKRLSLTYCAVSPSFEEMEAFKNAPDQEQALHDKLDDCIQGDYWRDEALHRLADKRIRPLKAVGAEGEIMLADYEWDYRLFSYVLTDGRDARDLLLAQYHVDANENLIYGTIERLPGSVLGIPIRLGTGQPLPQNRRAGMITTQWFLVTNTMFTPLPRTSAAQAYRAYLGQDIAKGEGIHPVQGEPRDLDNTGVQNPTCAACHSTLDPLAYSFSSYNGIVIPGLFQLGQNLNGAYDNGRPGDVGLGNVEGDGVLFGEPVGDLLDWATQAANSDEFKRNLVDMFWSQALGHGPLPSDNGDFKDLWSGLPAQQYSVDDMLHDFIDTDAFGAP